MGKRYVAVIVFLFVFSSSGAMAASLHVRVSVFNFGMLNIEASGLGASVTNMLIGSLIEDSSLAILDRKELEAFLSMNDLQQNDKIDNVVNIGNRLGLNMVVAGTVEKKGAMIVIQAKTIQVEQKKAILNVRAVAVGDAALAAEVKKIGQQIKDAIAEQLAKEKSGDGGSFPAPVQVRKRPGNRNIFLSWEDAPGATNVAGYDIFRASSGGGPYSRVAQVTKTEYLDEAVDKDTLYYYKIRAYNDRGLQSEFSSVIDAKTAITPNPPVILTTEAHAKGIALVWSPGPGSEDPLPLKGYRLYRARSEQGPYREVTTIQSRGGIGEVSTMLDRLLKVPHLDKGLDDGAEYHYRVTAYNEKDLESGFSRSVKGTTLPVVSSVNAEGELIREIRLTWKPLDSAFVKGYNIYRSTTEKENFTRIKRVDAPSGTPGRQMDYADRDGLKDQTRYFYRITAFEEGVDVETSPSSPASAVTRGRPPMPTEFKAASGLAKSVDLRWKASTADDVEGYKIYWSRDKEGQYAHLKTLSGRATDRFTDDSRGFIKLEDGATYYYRMTTYNRVDLESEATPSVPAVTKPRPSRPSGFQGQSAKARSVPVRWNQNAEKDIAIYHLFRAVGAQGGEFERIAKVQGNEYLDQGLKDDFTYLYRLQAEDKDGLLSDFSETVLIQTKPRPAKLEGAGGQVSGGKTILTWRVSGESDIVHYTVYEKKLFGVEKIATVRETMFSESGPQKGKTKTYVITATDKDGLESEPGAEIPVTGP